MHQSTLIGHAYVVKQEDLKGDIKDFPIEIVQKMVDEQVKQGNEADVTVFQENRIRPRNIGGFDWGITEEDNAFWTRIIYQKKFNVFFNKYPEGKDKYTFDKNGCLVEEKKDVIKDSKKEDENNNSEYEEEEVANEEYIKPELKHMTRNEIEFQRILTNMSRTYNQKNSDYGSSFDKSMDEFGMLSPIIRMSDKMNRLKSLVKNKQQVNDESIDDTLLDLANYAVMTLVYRNTNMDK